MLLFGTGEHHTDRDFVSASGVVGQLTDSDVIAISNLEVVLLHTHLEDEGVGIFETLTEPATHQEGLPVKVDTIVEIVEAALVLVHKVGRNDGSAESEGGRTTFFFGNVNEGAQVAREFDRQFGHTVEAVGGLGEMGSGKAGIPPRTVSKRTGVEVEIPHIGLFRSLGCGLTGIAVHFVNHVGEAEVLPVEAGIDHTGLEGSVDPHLAGSLETESIHHGSHARREGTMVALTVRHNDGTDTAMQVVDILVIGDRGSGERTHQRRPLASEIQAYARTNLSTGESRVHIERVGIELGEHNILCFNALTCK